MIRLQKDILAGNYKRLYGKLVVRTYFNSVLLEFTYIKPLTWQI